MCEAIYIGNTQHNSKKITDGHLSNILRLPKNGQEPNSFSAHFEKKFNTTTPHTDLRKYTMFKVLKQLNLIGAMENLQNPIEIYVFRNFQRSLKSYMKNAPWL